MPERTPAAVVEQIHKLARIGMDHERIAAELSVSESTVDRYIHGRFSLARLNAKLTEADVRAIRAQPEISNCEWARRLDVTEFAIRSVRSGRTWRHVDAQSAEELPGGGMPEGSS